MKFCYGYYRVDMIGGNEIRIVFLGGSRELLVIVKYSREPQFRKSILEQDHPPCSCILKPHLDDVITIEFFKLLIYHLYAAGNSIAHPHVRQIKIISSLQENVASRNVAAERRTRTWIRT